MDYECSPFAAATHPWVCVPSVLRRVFDSERVSNTAEKHLAVQVTAGFLSLQFQYFIPVAKGAAYQRLSRFAFFQINT